MIKTSHMCDKEIGKSCRGSRRITAGQHFYSHPKGETHIYIFIEWCHQFGRIRYCSVDYHFNVLGYLEVTQEVEGDNVFFNTVLLHADPLTVFVCHCSMTSERSFKYFAQLHFAYQTVCQFAQLQVQKRSFSSVQTELRSKQQGSALC